MARRDIIPTDMSRGIDMRSASPDPTTGRISQALANRAAQNFSKFSSNNKTPIQIKQDSNLPPPTTLSPPSTLTLQQNLPPSPKPKPKPQAKRSRKKKYETPICPPGCVPESRQAGKTKKKKKKRKTKRKTKRRLKRRIRGGASKLTKDQDLNLFGGSSPLASNIILGFYGGKRKLRKEKSKKRTHQVHKKYSTKVDYSKMGRGLDRFNSTSLEKLPDDALNHIDKILAALIIQDKAKLYNPRQSLYEELLIRGYKRYKEAARRTTNPKGNLHFINKLWTNLDPFHQFTADWLTRAAKVLDKKDFESKNFWWTVLEDMLETMKEIDEVDNPFEGIADHGLTGGEFDNYEKSGKAIIKIMEINNIDLKKNTEGKVKDSWDTILKKWQEEGDIRARTNPTALWLNL